MRSGTKIEQFKRKLNLLLHSIFGPLRNSGQLPLGGESRAGVIEALAGLGWHACGYDPKKCTAIGSKDGDGGHAVDHCLGGGDCEEDVA